MRAISDAQRVRVLPDPPVPGAPVGQWWPPAALTPAWLRANADDFDVLHVHFGLESFSAEELRAGLETARSLGRPVVYTVHDLQNPQLVDQAPYGALLDTLVPAADELLTLTPGAAAEIAARWGRESRVVPHPTLLEGDPAEAGQASAEVRVGIHLRDLRPNIAADEVIRAAVGAATLLEDVPVVFDVLMNERVRDDAAARRITEAALQHPAVRVRRTARLDDAAINAWIAGLDLFVLPYRHGTHSGWVELCYDLGVPVAGRDVGYVAAQHPAEFSPIALEDPHPLAAAVRRTAAAREPSAERARRLRRRRTERLAERDAVRRAHAEVYANARVRS